VSYVNSVLQPGETVKVIGKLHWTIFIRAVLFAAVGLVILVYSSKLETEKARELGQIVAGLAFVVAALAFLHAWFIRWITELAVTNHRVIYKRGFLRRYTVEMNMDKVETVDVIQSIMGRLLGYGTIRVRGTGQGIEDLSRVADPVGIRNAITAR